MITHVEVRMYRLGTGDCFALKFFAGAKLSFKMLIDCGTWKGTKANLKPFIKDLLQYMGNHVDLLVVTHEHMDHVHGFDVCRDLFTPQSFTVDRVWMGWTENEKSKKVRRWQRDHGQQKKALAEAAHRLQAAVVAPKRERALGAEADGDRVLAAEKNFTTVLMALAQLHANMGANGYVGPLAGMAMVKDTIGKNPQGEDRIEYFEPGDIVENVPDLPGIKFYVLGPPLSWNRAKQESGGEGETYDHNKDLAHGISFAAALLGHADGVGAAPFDSRYDSPAGPCPTASIYRERAAAWRTIEHDWLFSAGALALRANSITNNLSLALAIELQPSGKVMLFPGDAEYGSWASWHAIDWGVPSRTPGKHLTEDLLNRTVFYKVAHHLSHNGTAARLGLEMMLHPDLAAMATLDYDVISDGWKSTMPNRAILADLLDRTKGRLMVMNETGLHLDFENQEPLAKKIVEAQARLSAAERGQFDADFARTRRYLQYVVRG